jgi:hypothetical protein
VDRSFLSGITILGLPFDNNCNKQDGPKRRGDGGTTNNNVYIMHKEYAWVPARLLSVDGREKCLSPICRRGVYLTDNGDGATSWEEKTVSQALPGKTFPMQNVNKDEKLERKAGYMRPSLLHEVR